MLDLDSNLPGLFTSLAILDNSGDFNAEIYTSTPSGDLELSDLINPETLDFQSVDVLVSSLNATSEIGQFAEVMGTSENDTLTGTLENDQLNGMTGDDDLLGEAGDDTLYGGRGLDILSGGLGNDYLSGDRDSDFLFGGAGADTFALTLSPPDAGFSADVVLDFNPLEDFLGLTGGLTEADLSLEAAEFEPGRIDTLVWHSASSTLLGAITDTSVEQLTGRFLEASPITSVAVPTLNTAIDLGSLGVASINEFVGDVDPMDIYRFSLDTDSNLNITLDGLVADADVALVQDLNGNGEIEITDIVNRSEAPADFSEAITANALPGGTYYVVVYQYTGNTGYTLDISASPNAQPDTDATLGQFDSQLGYGLIDASAAVAQAVGLTPFVDVPDLGGNDWGRDLVNAPEVWATGTTGIGVTVAVIDSGVDYNHPDLAGNIWTNADEIPNNGLDDDSNGYVDDFLGWDFVDRDPNPMDLNGHGTHVSGIVAARQDGVGITGVAPNAQIMPIRVLDEDGFGKVSDAVRGIQYAVVNGADVINLSLGGDSFTSAEYDAIRWATEQGVVVVMAAGNEAGNQPNFPARFAQDFGIAVGSVDQNQTLSSFSNRAGLSRLDYVVAPGGDGGFPSTGDIYSTVPLSLSSSSYAFLAGTSMATPHVAGIAALIRQANPSLTATDIEQIIISTANLSAVNA